MDAEELVQQQSQNSNVSNNHLTAQQLFQHDPVLRRFKDRLKVNSFWFILGSSLLSIGIFIVAYALAGIPFTPNSSLIAILNVFSTVLFFWIYFQLPTNIARLFNTLLDNQVLLVNSPRKITRVSYQGFLKQFGDWIDSYVWLFLFEKTVDSGRVVKHIIEATPHPSALNITHPNILNLPPSYHQ